MRDHPIRLASQDRVIKALKSEKDLAKALEEAQVKLAYHEKWLATDEVYRRRVLATRIDADRNAAKRLKAKKRQDRRRHKADARPKKMTPDEVALYKAKMVSGVARHGTPYGAAKAIDLNHSTHCHWLRTDPEYRQAVRDSMELHTEILEDAAIRKSLDGSVRPKYHRGELVGYEVVHHDQMHMFMMKGRRPEVYRSGKMAADAATVPMDVIHPEVSVDAKIARMKEAMVKLGYPAIAIAQTAERARQLSSTSENV